MSTVTGVVTNYTTPLSWTVGYDSRNRLISFKESLNKSTESGGGALIRAKEISR